MQEKLAELIAAISDIGAQILIVGCQKGGVLKTNVAANLGAHIAAQDGQKVLLLDPDQQGSLTGPMLGVDGDDGLNLAMVMQYGVTASTRLEPRGTGRDDLDILPGGIHLAGAPMAVGIAAMNAGYGSASDYLALNLAHALAEVVEREGYTTIICDTGPGDVTVLDALLKIGRWLVVPTEADELSVGGVVLLGDRYSAIRNQGFPIELLGVVLTLISPRATARNAECKARINRIFGIEDAEAEGFSAVLDSMIRHSPAAAVDMGKAHMLPSELLEHRGGFSFVGDGSGRRWSRSVRDLVEDYNLLGNEILGRLVEAYTEAQEDGEM